MAQIQSKTGKDPWLILRFRARVLELEGHQDHLKHLPYMEDAKTQEGRYFPKVTQPVHGRTGTEPDLFPHMLFTMHCIASFLL